MTEGEGPTDAARANGGAGPVRGHERHLVRCLYCREAFDLFAAPWCGHGGTTHPSKRCLHCGRCLCQHPSYADPSFWKEARPAFKRNGFRQLFLLYV